MNFLTYIINESSLMVCMVLRLFDTFQVIYNHAVPGQAYRGQLTIIKCTFFAFNRQPLFLNQRHRKKDRIFINFTQFFTKTLCRTWDSSCSLSSITPNRASAPGSSSRNTKQRRDTSALTSAHKGNKAPSHNFENITRVVFHRVCLVHNSNTGPDNANKDQKADSEQRNKFC